MQNPPQNTSKRYIATKCLRITLDAISVLNVIMAILMIIGAASTKNLFHHYHFTSWYSSLHNLPNLWIATGFFLLIFSIFGVFATFKNSTKLINLYAISLAFVFILQMAAGITGFTLLPQTGRITRSTIDSIMSHYPVNNRYMSTMDWIQQTFQCCGNRGPADWEAIVGSPPQSCCFTGSEGNDNNYCEYYHVRGCHSSVYDMVFRSILLIGITSLVIGLLQVWGVICAVVMASKVRRNKTQRDVLKWTVQSLGLDKAASIKTKPEEETDGQNNYI